MTDDVSSPTAPDLLAQEPVAEVVVLRLPCASEDHARRFVGWLAFEEVDTRRGLRGGRGVPEGVDFVTTDSPKGPEREARPEESLRERLAQIISFQWGFDEKQFGATNADRIAAAVARVVVEPELERITAEVGQLRAESAEGTNRAGVAISALASERDEWKQAAGAEADLLDQANAEVSRLREQLAAAVVLPKDARHRIWSVLFVCAREGDTPNATALSVLDLIQSWRVSSSEVEAPQPQPGHKVQILTVPGGFAAECLRCQDGMTGSEQQAEDWKDQHEADTLRPAGLTNESFISPQDEGRPSCSERLAPRPSEAAALVREFHETFGLPINDTTRTLNKLRADLVREEGNEAADAIEDGAPEAWAKELADLVIVAFGAALTLGIDLDRAVRLVHASNMSKLGDDGKPVMREDGKVLKGPNYEPPDMSSALLQDAAQAARSEATPEDLSHVCACDHGKADHHGFLPGCAACACREFRPSPSLRKEGEDR